MANLKLIAELISSLHSFAPTVNAETATSRVMQQISTASNFDYKLDDIDSTENLNDTTTSQVDSSVNVQQRLLTDMLGYKISLQIHLIWLPIIIPIGLVGNITSFTIFSRPKNRAISCCIYMCGLAVTDCGMLAVAAHYYIRTIYVLVIKKMDMNTFRTPDFECKATSWIFQICSLTGIYLILCMTVDRLIGVKYPFHALRFCTPSRAKKILICLPITISIYTIPYVLLSKAIGPSCVSLAVQSTFTTVFSYITLCLSCFIPFFCLLTMNCMIITTMLQRKASQLSSECNQGQAKSREKQLVMMMLLVSFTFLILTSPLYIRYLLYQYIEEQKSLKSMAVFYLILHLTNKMYYTNHAVNFILYCIGGSKFRQDLKGLCKCWRVKEKPKNSKTIKNFKMPSMRSTTSTCITSDGHLSSVSTCAED